ncbi:dicarboxylate/amino acid:cation symporter [bacterium]|nr:dicarboxylate/amino acid:cation symporter [bacterium]
MFLYSYNISKITFLPDSIIILLRASALFITVYVILERILKIKIYSRIFIGLITGVIAGIVFKTSIAEIKPVGDLFIRLIRMIIIPLVFASLLVGSASMNPKKMGRIGAKTLIYYLVYTAVAVFIGLVLANIFQPGSGLPESVKTDLLKNFSNQGAKVSHLASQSNPINILLQIVPTNVFESLSSGKLLPIIFFAIFTGIALTMIPKEKAVPVLSFFEGINDAMIVIVNIVIKIAPYGVFALIASVVANFGTDILMSLLKYLVITIFGLVILNFTYPPVVKMFSGMKMGDFLKGIRPAQLIAFSTSSSSATLPVTIKTCEEVLGVPPDIASFVLPLGATVNMNGTALYQGVSAIFIAQVFGIDLSISGQLLIVLTATLASIGTAGAPMAGVLMLVIVLEQVGIPPEGLALILGVERILDMFRTTINITGDASAAVIIAASEGELKMNKKMSD